MCNSVTGQLHGMALASSPGPFSAFQCCMINAVEGAVWPARLVEEHIILAWALLRTKWHYSNNEVEYLCRKKGWPHQLNIAILALILSIRRDKHAEVYYYVP